MTVSLSMKAIAPSDSRSQGQTFHMRPEDRIVAKKVVVSSEEDQPVEVTSLNWIKRSSTVAHLVVSFLHHHVEYVVECFLTRQTSHLPVRIIDPETKSVLTHVAIHIPVYVSPPMFRHRSHRPGEQVAGLFSLLIRLGH